MEYKEKEHVLLLGGKKFTVGISSSKNNVSSATSEKNILEIGGSMSPLMGNESLGNS